MLVTAVSGTSNTDRQIREWLVALAGEEPVTIIANLPQLEVIAAWRRLVLRGLMEPNWAEQCVHRMQGWPAIARENLTRGDLSRSSSPFVDEGPSVL